MAERFNRERISIFALRSYIYILLQFVPLEIIFDKSPEYLQNFNIRCLFERKIFRETDISLIVRLTRITIMNDNRDFYCYSCNLTISRLVILAFVAIPDRLYRLTKTVWPTANFRDTCFAFLSVISASVHYRVFIIYFMYLFLDWNATLASTRDANIVVLRISWC